MFSRYFSKGNDGLQEDNINEQEVTEEEGKRKVDSIPLNLPKVPLPKYMKWSQVHTNVHHELDPIQEEEGRRNLTPLESQVMDLKAKYPKLTLFVECGYRYRFFGEDAIAAAKVLDIALIRDSKFLTASLPNFSGPMKYVRKFVEQGYKIGIVSQEEELSSHYGRNLSRSVTEIYTQGTLLNTDIPLTDSIKDGNTDLLSGIIAVYETPRKHLSSNISIVYFDPKNGRIIYDQFIDSRFRDQLSSRIISFGAVEILFDELESTKETKDVLGAISSEVMLEPCHYNFKSDNCYPLEMSKELKNVIENENLDILKCIGAIYNYLKEFNIHDCLCKTGNVTNFRDMPRFMKLTSYTMHNLDLFKTKDGSVFDLLNKTCTKFGSRILRNWLAYPLLSIETITSRQEAIEELISDEILLKTIRGFLYRMPDLELALMSTLNKRISPKDFYLFIKEMKKSYDACKTLTPKSRLLQNIVQNIIKRLHGVERHIKNINPYSFSSNKVTLWSQIFMDYSEYPEVYKVRESLEEIEWSLETHKLRLMSILGEYTFEYSSLGGVDYLIEVKNNTKVPDSWIKVSNTKSSVRYRDPVIQDKVSNLSSMKETLNNVCIKAWKDFLSKFSLCNIDYQYGINSLAELDALFALAIVSKSEYYVKPIFTESTFDIHNGRNLILEHIQGHGSPTLIPNDLYLNEQRTLIITGPNSGGKSSFVRQTALISILAQMGCFVPATKARLPIVDAIFLRTGAKDDIWNGKSTFHVEMEETCDIVRSASRNSLVLLDELGRGTSSYDGLALAESVLKHLIFKSNSFNLFVTHYGTLSSEFEKLYGDKVKNAHAGYAFLSNREESSSPILLYKISPGGTANKSYGINVARLAGLPSDVLERASSYSLIYERDFYLKSKIIQLIHEYH